MLSTTPMEAALGIDLGGTNARVALVTRDGRILTQHKQALLDRTPEGTVDAVAAAVDVCLGGAAGAEVAACGVGVAGQLREGVVVVAPNLGWSNVPLRKLLETRLGRRVLVRNDLSAAAWGEYRAGAGRGQTDTFTVFVGSGVGSAIITNGRLVEGNAGVAGEFGHVKVVPQGGRPCGCGEAGCLEAYAGGHNLIRWMQEEGLSGTPADLEARALDGDPTARRLYDFAVGNLALAIANQVTVLNPGALVLGGGVLFNCPGMVRSIFGTVDQCSAKVARTGLRKIMAELKDDSGIVGAALLAFA
jgi:glucokinase